MAKANKITEVVKIPVTTYKEETKVTGIQLNLSMAEAKAPHTLCGSIGGESVNSIRKYADGIYSALRDAVLDVKFNPFKTGCDTRSWPEGQDPFKD